MIIYRFWELKGHNFGGLLYSQNTDWEIFILKASTKICQ